MIATIVISLLIAAVLGMIVRSMVLKARAGKSVMCDGGCGGCPLNGACQSKAMPPIGQQMRASGKPVIALTVVNGSPTTRQSTAR